MKTKVVKNISNRTQYLPNVGAVESGKEVTVSGDFHNGNFEDVKPKSTRTEKSTKKEAETDED